MDEDEQAFLAAHRAPAEAELNAPDYYAIMQARLDGNVGPGTYDALRKALKDIGGELVELDGASLIQMNVTYPTVTLPEDVEAELRTRVDGELGAGTLNSIKAVLRGMGLAKAVVRRKSEVVL